jgi:hypothetical protein
VPESRVPAFVGSVGAPHQRLTFAHAELRTHRKVLLVSLLSLGTVRLSHATDSVLWQFNTDQDFVNGVAAKGGSLNGSGPAGFGRDAVCGSGADLGNGIRGNVLLVVK